MRILLIIFLWPLIFNAGTGIAAAAIVGQFQLEPKTIDLVLEQGEVVEKKIYIENKSDVLLEAYASVAEYDQVVEGQGSPSQNGLGSWISVFRGLIRLSPGEKKEVPLKIDVSGNASPGDYFAYLNFSSNPAVSGNYSSLIHAKVYAKIVEKAELQEFKPIKTIYLHSPYEIAFKIKNLGNQTIIPNGTLRIYDRRGEEVKQLKIEDHPIEPESTQEYRSSWKDAGVWGRYKARLVMEYGQNNGRDIQDVTFFWVLPLKMLIAYLSILAALMLLIIILAIRRNRKRSAI